METNGQRIDNEPEYEAFGCQYNGCNKPTTPESRDYCDQHIFPEERNPIITGDSDTDELLEDERMAQENDTIWWNNIHAVAVLDYIEDLAIDEIDDIDYKRFTGLDSDTPIAYADEYFLNERAEEVEDLIVQQQINTIRGK